MVMTIGIDCFGCREKKQPVHSMKADPAVFNALFVGTFAGILKKPRHGFSSSGRG
jgi:hypothetical protein